MPTKPRTPVYPILLLFIILNAFFIAGKGMLQRWGADQQVLIIGNLLLFGITLLSFWFASKGLKSSNPHAFMRGVNSSILIKLFLCAIAAFAYIATNRSHLNKPALFTLMGLYLVYTFMEVSSLTKLLRRPANG
jgi:Ca2+/Na+ antiporter